MDRKEIKEMTDRELLEEIADSQRKTQELVENFVNSMSKNPMLKAFAGRFGG